MAFQERMKKEDTEIESSCTKTQLLIETLTEEIWTAALRETEIEDQDESDQYSIFGKFRHLGFACKEINGLFGSQVAFYE